MEEVLRALRATVDGPARSGVAPGPGPCRRSLGLELPWMARLTPDAARRDLGEAGPQPPPAGVVAIMEAPGSEG